MENLENKELNKAKKQDKKELSSNPIKKNKSLVEDLKMISVPKNKPASETQTLVKTKKKLDNLIKPISVPEENSLTNIVETINNFNNNKTKPRSYTDNYASNLKKVNTNINYFDVMRSISDAFSAHKSMVDLLARLNNIFVNQLKWNFVGFGLLHEKSKCINLKLFSQTGNTYSSKVFLSDEKNPIVQCLNNKVTIDKDNINYLNIPYLVKTSSVIVPMMSVNKCIGVMLVGQSISNINTNLVSFFSNYMGMFIHNVQLQEQTNKYANTDTLTSLYNHRGFQEILAN